MSDEDLMKRDKRQVTATGAAVTYFAGRLALRRRRGYTTSFHLISAWALSSIADRLRISTRRIS